MILIVELLKLAMIIIIGVAMWAWCQYLELRKEEKIREELKKPQYMNAIHR